METLHPAFVHFAVVLPLMALTFQALYLLKSEKIYSKVGFVTLVFALIFVGASYFSGGEDAKSVAEILSVYDSKGMSELKEHAQLGFYLFIALALVAGLKLANTLLIKKKSLDIVIVIALLGLSGMMLVQGKEGGEIVYKHGTIFEAHEMKDILKESLSESREEIDLSAKAQILREGVQSALKIEE